MEPHLGEFGRLHLNTKETVWGTLTNTKQRKQHALELQIGNQNPLDWVPQNEKTTLKKRAKNAWTTRCAKTDSSQSVKNNGGRSTTQIDSTHHMYDPPKKTRSQRHKDRSLFHSRKQLNLSKALPDYSLKPIIIRKGGQNYDKLSNYGTSWRHPGYQGFKIPIPHRKPITNLLICGGELQRNQREREIRTYKPWWRAPATS